MNWLLTLNVELLWNFKDKNLCQWWTWLLKGGGFIQKSRWNQKKGQEGGGHPSSVGMPFGGLFPAFFESAGKVAVILLGGSFQWWWHSWAKSMISTGLRSTYILEYVHIRIPVYGVRVVLRTVFTPGWTWLRAEGRKTYALPTALQLQLCWQNRDSVDKRVGDLLLWNVSKMFRSNYIIHGWRHSTDFLLGPIFGKISLRSSTSFFYSSLVYLDGSLTPSLGSL